MRERDSFYESLSLYLTEYQLNKKSFLRGYVFLFIGYRASELKTQE